VRLSRGEGGEADPRDQPLFQPGKVTVSTIKSAKGYTAHVCHVAFVHELDEMAMTRPGQQPARAELHVACTRATMFLYLWGLPCGLMEEAIKAHYALV